mmetsp:Transcript_63983/g.128387  ORF Transcript_63983/g.128387 Transcript_63983/m.128387 type:complete len:259 (+) Transcript_63983:121-897(+)
MLWAQMITSAVGGGLGNVLLWHVIAICPDPDGASWHPFEKNFMEEHAQWRRPWTSTASFAKYWVSPCVKNHTELVVRWYSKTVIPVEHPVLHWRCSDVPFERHPDYELPSLEVAPMLRELLLARGHKQLLVVTDQKYKRRKETRHCAALLQVYLDAIGLPYVYSKSRQKHRDFMILRNAPLVISLINSSFAFAAKLHDLGNYFVVYTNGGAKPSSDIPWQLSVPTLPHSLFADYDDVDSVIATIRASARSESPVSARV